MSDPQPILYVIDSFKDPNAGTEGQLFQLIKHIDRTQYIPELLVFSGSKWLEVNEFPCSVSVLGQRSLSSPKTWWSLAAFAKSFSAKGGRLAHVFFNDPSIICPPVFYFFGIKTLISRRDMGYWYSSVNKKVLNFSRLFACGAAVNSQAVAQVTCKAEGFKSSQVHVIYNGYEPLDSSYERVSELEALKSQNLIILALVANIRPIKRIDDVLSALAILRNQGYEFAFVQIGDGDPKELSALAEQLKISGQVMFLGKRNDVQACLQYIDIGLLCSESEGFSNAIVEYLRQGLPVICSDVGGNGEAVKQDKTGFLYPCGDVQALAKAIQMLSINEEQRLAMGRNAKQDSTERFSVEMMVGEYVNLYNSLLKGKGMNK